ncbi:MAG: hypothetical protein FJ077_06360 [Cyanobacteria bacterium K_DeepCast_35m_m2_023]|nr:hypothetical protein [Cyanobacteria bacterium K_DeepCast_35m_m2_023]
MHVAPIDSNGHCYRRHRRGPEWACPAATGTGATADLSGALPFYANTDKLNPNGKPLGTVLASEPADSTIAGSKAWRIAYVSSDTVGRRTVVTGLIAVPDGPAPAGGRPLVAWAHGTTGTARRCGPSQLPLPAQPLNQYLLSSGTSYSDFGLPAMETFLKRGYVIVATDYQGLGGPGDHQYA